MTQKYAVYWNQKVLFFNNSQGIHQQLDKIIVVTAPENIRIARVMKRDKVSKEQVLQRISNQLPEAEKVKRADYLIYNDESKSVIEQTLAIQKQLLAL